MDARAKKQNLLRVLGWGAGNGAVYGALISWLHIRLNEVDSIGSALGALLVFVLLYAVLSLVAFLAAAVLWRFVPRKWRERTLGGRGAAIFGLFLFTLGFWELALLYGLTYGQTVLFHPQRALGMALYLLLAASLIGLVCAAAVWIAVRALRSIEALGARRRRLSAAGLVATALVAHLVSPILARRQSDLEPRAGAQRALADRELSELDVERTDTGLNVIVVGLDGLDPWVVDELIAAGQLPTFAALRARGASGEMASLPDANSAVIWASIYSGKTPREHGIDDFYRVRLPLTGEGLFPVHRTYFKELAGFLDRAGLATFDLVERSSLHSFPYWEIADHFGLSVGVVDGYLYSYPAPSLDTPGSYFLSYGLDSLAHLLDQALAEPEDLPLRLQPVDLLPAGELPRAADFDWQAAMLLRLLAEREQPRLINFYAHEPDAVQHAHWRQLQAEKYFGADPTMDGGPVTEMYRRFDRFLAALDERVDERTAVLVVSDHGHSPTMVHRLDTQHRHGPPGAMLLFGGPFRQGVLLSGASVYDVFPTVLYLLGLPAPEDAAGTVLWDALRPEMRAEVPPRTIPSYQGLWHPAIRKVGQNRRLNQIEIEKLKSMGYL